MLFSKKVVCVFFVYFFACYHTFGDPVTKHEEYMKDISAAIKKGGSNWHPQVNHFIKDKKIDDMKNFLGVKPSHVLRSRIAEETTTESKKFLEQITKTLPNEFDWRMNNNCSSIKRISMQTCSDCYAISATSVISDRFCIWTGKTKLFSSRHVETCIHKNEGCNPGLVMEVMSFYASKGIASGGDQGISSENLGCLPYIQMDNVMQCPGSCDDGENLDFTRAGDYFDLPANDEKAIMAEIATFGPVVATLEIFEDFAYYSSGVYQHVTGNSIGWHAVKLLGYGVEKEKKYWLAANSWGTEWGDKGFFKILRGENHCSVERYVVTVYPIEAYKNTKFLQMKFSDPKYKYSRSSCMPTIVVTKVTALFSLFFLIFNAKLP